MVVRLSWVSGRALVAQARGVLDHPAVMAQWQSTGGSSQRCPGSSGCHGSVAEHWWLKPEVSWIIRLSWLSGRALVAQARGALGSTPGDCQPFHFPLFCLITSKFVYFQRQARCSEHFATPWLHYCSGEKELCTFV